MRKQYEIDDGTSTIEYIQVLLKQFEKCHSSDILPIILKEIQKIPVYMCAEKRYVKLMLALLDTFQQIRYDPIDDRITQCLLSFEWFKTNFQIQRQTFRRYFKHFHVVVYENSQVILAQGTPSEDFCVLIQGKAYVTNETNRKRATMNMFRTVLTRSTSRRFQQSIKVEDLWEPKHFIEQGQAFGQLGILYRKKRMATIVSINRSIVIRIQGQVYVQINTDSGHRFHQRRFQFICDRLSNEIKSLPYRTLQEFLMEFQPVVFSYGTEIFNSCLSQHYVFIEEGTTATYSCKKNKGLLNRIDTLSSGMLIGFDKLIHELNLDEKQDILDSIQQESVKPYTVTVISSELRGYRIKQEYLQNIIVGHNALLEDIILRKQQYYLARKLRIKRKQRMRASVDTLDRGQHKSYGEQCVVQIRYKKATKLVRARISELTQYRCELSQAASQNILHQHPVRRGDAETLKTPIFLVHSQT